MARSLSNDGSPGRSRRWRVARMTSAAPSRSARRRNWSRAKAAHPPPLRTTTVRVRRGTLPDEAAVRDWLREREKALPGAVRGGPVIIR